MWARLRLFASLVISILAWIGLTFFVIAISALATIVVRERLLSGDTQVSDAALGLIGFSIVVVGVLLFWNLLPEKIRARLPGVPRGIVATVSAMLSVSAITFILSPDLGQTLDPIRQILMDSGFLRSPGANAPSINAFAERAHDAIGTILAALSAGAVVIAATGFITEALSQIAEVNKFTHQQRIAARRLRQPAEGAIRQRNRLTHLFPTEVQIERFSVPRQFPFDVTGRTKRARIKLMIREGQQSFEGEDFSFQRIKHLIESDRIDLHQSIFLVCAVNRRQETQVIAYGSGHELEEISSLQAAFEESGELGVSVSEAFYDSLNKADKERARRVVDAARKHILDHEPAKGLLLSSTTHAATDELASALNIMDERALDRMLLVSRWPPFERGILGSADIAQFLLGGRPIAHTAPSESHHSATHNVHGHEGGSSRSTRLSDPAKIQ